MQAWAEGRAKMMTGLSRCRMKKIDKIIYDMNYKSTSQKGQWSKIQAKGGGKEYGEKRELINKIIEEFGEECVERDYTKQPFWGHSFRKPNLLVLKYGIINLILHFHYSEAIGREEIGLYGFDKNLINEVIDNINKNPSEKIFFNLLFILDIPGEKVEYFSIPIFFVKNIENSISVTGYKGTVGPRYIFHIEKSKNKFYFKLKNKSIEDISQFKIDIKDLFSENLIKIYNEEKIRYETLIKEQELLKNLIKK